MARRKIVDGGPRFLPIVLEAQLRAGSFEHALASANWETKPGRSAGGSAGESHPGVPYQHERGVLGEEPGYVGVRKSAGSLLRLTRNRVAETSA